MKVLHNETRGGNKNKHPTPKQEWCAEAATSAGGRQRRRNWCRVSVAVAVAVAALVVWNEVLKYRVIAKRWGVVEPGQIYRSGQVSKWLIERMLVRHQIGVVVDLTRFDPADEHQRAELAAAGKLGVEHIRFPLSGDGTGDIHCYADAIKVLVDCQQAGRPVLIHCAAGADRTGGVVFAYRVLVQRKSAEAAVKEMRSYGWRPGDENILPNYLNSHMAQLAALLVEKGVLDRVPDELPVLAPESVVRSQGSDKL